MGFGRWCCGASRLFGSIIGLHEVCLLKARYAVWFAVLVVVVGGAVVAVLALRQQTEDQQGALPGSQQESSAGEPSGSEILVAGTFEAAGPAADVARQIGTAYVIVRDAERGPPYAVKRLQLADSRTSFRFELTPSDVMIPGAARPQKPVLKIRLDADGDPMTELPGDVVAIAEDFAWGVSNLVVQAKVFEGAP